MVREPTNPRTVGLIMMLRKQSAEQAVNVWRRIADDLEKPRRQHRIVNLSLINRHASPEETVVVPGKVLGAGQVSSKLTVAALSFSSSARARIEAAKGICLTLQELLEKNPKGTKVRILG